jgi:hydrogenase expression/formation protein HypD
MKHTDEYRDPAIARRLIADILSIGGDTVRVMEFCGGHTHSIMRYGIRQALAPAVRMLSGPGCPVCVTADSDIDRAIDLAYRPGVTVATFGDMIRVPGSRASLQEARATGARIHVVYSALDALELARRNPRETVVMLGIGFETTAPTLAASLVQARGEGLANYYVYSMHKLTPPAMRAILDTGEVRVDAVLGPGHVTAITGWHAWDFLPQDYGIPCAVSGFEPVDILQAIKALAHDHAQGSPKVTNPYSRGVTADGNVVARALLDRVFETSTARWRGFGEVPASGLAISPEFAAHDAEKGLDMAPAPADDPGHRLGCLCGEVLRGVIDPPECPLFGRACTPARPVGPCMVSAEGACAAHHRYGGSVD